jgi:hypothetical protein
MAPRCINWLRSRRSAIASVAIAYVQFALDRPALFRIMFSEPCDRDNDERVAATAAMSLYVRGIVERSFPDADAEPLATAIWGLVHGLAFLHLDGKPDASTPATVAAQASAAIEALLSATKIGPGSGFGDVEQPGERPVTAASAAQNGETTSVSTVNIVAATM